MKKKVEIMDEVAVKRALTRLSYEIVEKSQKPEEIVLVGIKTRGVPIAKALQMNIENNIGKAPVLEELDISAYRDDIDASEKNIEKGLFGVDITGKEVIIVDDVLYTGRTIRAAIEAIFAQGRPGKIGLAVLIDRGHRELPIRPDYIGKNVPTSQKEKIVVHIQGIDSETSVNLFENL